MRRICFSHHNHHYHHHQIPSALLFATPVISSSSRFLSIIKKRFSPSGVEWVSISGLDEEDAGRKGLPKRLREKNSKVLHHDDTVAAASTTTTAKPTEHHNSKIDNHENPASLLQQRGTGLLARIIPKVENMEFKKKLEFESLFHSHHHFVNATRSGSIPMPVTIYNNEESSSSNETPESVAQAVKRFNFSVSAEDDDAPSCPIRRKDFDFQDQLAFALRDLQVSDYFISKMQKRTPLPRTIYHPSDDSSAVFMCRYFLNHRFDEASDAEIVARLKLGCKSAQRHKDAKPRQQQQPDAEPVHNHHKYRNAVIPALANAAEQVFCYIDQATGLRQTCELLRRRGYWRLLKRKLADARSTLMRKVFADGASNDVHGYSGTWETIQKNSFDEDIFPKKRVSSNTSGVAVHRPWPKASAFEGDKESADGRFSYLYDIDTIESVTHRLSIVVQPERIITISRYPVSFVAELEAKFEHQSELEPPINFICDLVMQCSKTFIKAARTELRFVDQLEGIFFEQQSKRERTNSYKTMLYQLHRVSRRASISCSVLPQSIGAFGDLCTALQQTTVKQQMQRQQQQQHEKARQLVRHVHSENKDEKEIRLQKQQQQQCEESPAYFRSGNACSNTSTSSSSCSSSSASSSSSPSSATTTLTAQQIALSNRKVRDTISHMKSALALHSDVYESTRVVMALFFQESTSELEELTRTLTTFSAVFIPMSFVTTVFGANVEGLEWLYQMNCGFYLVSGVMLVIGVGTHSWLRRAVL